MHLLEQIVYRIKQIIPDIPFLKLQYRYHLGQKLNLNNPKTFNEKIHWLKLYDKKPEYTTYVDKYAVREHIKETIGEEYLIPLIGVYDNVEDIDWDSLPDKFVLKCTHGSQCNIICEDKSELDVETANRKLTKWMNRNWYWYGREWPYKNVKPRILCEEYLVEKKNESLTDYKVYCFNGEPLYCQVIRNRGQNETIDFYDRDWNHMPFSGLRNLPNANISYEKPQNYEKMLEIAGILAGDIPFIRVDLYSIDGQIKFGELTFSPVSGFGKFRPEEWNYKIGDLISLPKQNGVV